LTAALRVDQQKAERAPVIGLYGEGHLLRPYVYSSPAADIYYNVWQAGVAVRLDIGGFYHSSARIRSAGLELEVSRTRVRLRQHEGEVPVRNDYNLCLESWDILGRARQDVVSADENYRIVEKKYRNQLDLITDVIDADNTKIEAEIRVNDAMINTRYTYYQLL